MNSIASLLNLGNADYQNSLTRKKTQEEEASLAVAKEKLAQEKLERQELSQQLQETAESQQNMRRLYQMEQEIEKLSQAQAQMVLEMVKKQVSDSTAIQLQQMQAAGNVGLMVPAYV